MSLSWKDNVVRNFDSKSVTYDQNCPVQQTVAANFAADLPGARVRDILEIGCGTGNLTGYLLQQYQGCNISVTDISPAMVAMAKSRHPDSNIYWGVMDGENPDDTKTYDLIAANMVFQWFEDFDAALNRLTKMLNPGGSLLYSMPGPESFKEWKAVLKALDLPIGIIEFPVSEHIYRQEEITHDYGDAFDFLRSMKDIGAGTARKDYTPLPHIQLKQACAALDQNHGGEITWHIVYGRIDKGAT